MARKARGNRMKKPSSKYQKVLVDAQAMRQLQVYRYPFSVATSQPKIPDGCNTQTLGIKLQKQLSIKSDSILFVLLPIYGCLLRVRYAALADGTAVNMDIKHEALSPYLSAGNNFQFNMQDAYTAYRLVSAGLRLKLISNDNENYGYWEAIRFNTSELSGNFWMSTTTVPADQAATANAPAVIGGQESRAGTFHVANSFIDTLYNKSNWLNNPTYQMGKLKSLSQFEFRLSPQVEEHEFISIPKRIEFGQAEIALPAAPDPVPPGYTAPTEPVPLATDGIDLKHLFQFGMDPAFDGIAVFCTGFKSGADATASASSILAHTCYNYEFKLDPDSNVNLFTTETTNAGTALKSKQLDFKIRDRLPGHYLAGPRS